MSRPTRYFVYTLLDADGEPIYVGRSSNVANRLRGHAQETTRDLCYRDGDKAKWFYRVRSLTIAGPYTYDVAARMERQRIERLQPAGNIRHTDREFFGGGARR